MSLVFIANTSQKLELSRAQNPRRVAWYLLHVQAGNDNYIDLLNAQIMLLKLKLRGVVPVLEVEYDDLISSLVW